MPKARKRGLYQVTADFAATDLCGSGSVDENGELIIDGRGSVVWCAGAVVELDTATAAWVNKNHEGVLADYVEEVGSDE